MTMMFDEYMGWEDEKYVVTDYQGVQGIKGSQLPKRPELVLDEFWGQMIKHDILEIPDPPQKPIPPPIHVSGGGFFYE